MGIYSHYTDSELTALRTRFVDALNELLTGPTAAQGNGRSVQFQRKPDELRASINEVNNEIAKRAGTTPGGGPIYMV